MKKIFTVVLLSMLVLSCGNASQKTETKDRQAFEKADGIKIASFNVKFFNEKKSKKEGVMQVVSSIITKFDMVAFQEIQGKHNATVKRLHSRLGGDYDYIVTGRLGHSKYYKERYAYFYDNRIFLHVDSYVYEDKLDEFSREPFVALFKLIKKDKKIVLINIHTKPAHARKEIPKLPDVIESAKKKYPNTEIIVLGDFNADCAYFNEKKYEEVFPSSKYIWVVKNDVETSLVSGCTLDRIVMTKGLFNKKNKTGVYDFGLKHGLSLEGALKVSDHFPVWVMLEM